MPYPNGFDYRRKITILGSQVSGSLSSFPVPIFITHNDLRDTVNGGNVVNSTYLDIRFETNLGVKLDHEIERYVNTTGQVVAHARIPTLTTTDLEIYIYYGKSGLVATEENITSVWDSDFIGVWHLENLLDSTSNNNDMTNDGATGPVAGKAGRCYSFDGVNDRLYISDNISLRPNYLTMECLVYLDGTLNAENGPISKTRWNLILNTARLFRVEVENGGFQSVWTGGADDVDMQTWTHLAGTYDGAALRGFLNGVQKSYGAKSGTINSDSAELTIGTHLGGRFPGLIDEVRISRIARSADWLLTTSKMFIDQAHLTIGAQEQYDQPIGPFPTFFNP